MNSEKYVTDKLYALFVRDSVDTNGEKYDRDIGFAIWDGVVMVDEESGLPIEADYDYAVAQN